MEQLISCDSETKTCLELYATHGIDEQVISMGYFGLLPDELIIAILQHLELPAINNFSVTNKYSRKVASDTRLWEWKCRANGWYSFWLDTTNEPPREKIEWRMTYTWHYIAFNNVYPERLGQLEYPDRVYNGDIHDGVASGYGIARYADGSVYLGTWENDCRNGKGRFVSAKNNVYYGDFMDDCQHGVGILKYREGNIYTGSFVNNKKHGHGQLVTSTGTYTGEFCEGSVHGFGEFVRLTNWSYKGMFVNNACDGLGTISYRDGTHYTGQVKGMCREGRGYLTRHNDVIYGIWAQNVLIQDHQTKKRKRGNSMIIKSDILRYSAL